MSIYLMCLVAFVQTPEPGTTSVDTIRGIVTTADGDVVANAKVALTWMVMPGFEVTTNLAQTSSDGRFEFPEQADKTGYWSLLVFQTGFAVEGHRGPPMLKPGGLFRSVEIELKLSTPVEILVRQPDQQPLEKGRLRCSQIYLPGMSPNPSEEAVRNLLPNSEIVDGMATIDGFPTSGHIIIDFQTEQYGLQTANLRLDSTTGSDFRFQLQPLCKLGGKLIDVDGVGPFEGVKLVIGSGPKTNEAKSEYTSTSSNVTIDVNPDGTFESDQVAAGFLNIECVVPEGRRYLENRIQRQSANPVVLKPDTPLVLELKMKQAVHVTGKVIGEDGSSVKGANLFFNGKQETDEDGTYTFWSPPGTIYGQFRDAPDPWLKPAGMMHYLTVPQGVENFEAPTIQLARAARITGVVVDENDEPVANASVSATWQMSSQDGVIERGNDWTQSDEHGRFVLKKTTDDYRVELTADTDVGAVPQEIFVRPGGERDVKLKVLKSEKMAISGVVVDTQGVPIENAKVEVWQTYDFGSSVLTIDGARRVTTDKQGWIQTPSQMTRRYAHKLVVFAEGFATLDTGDRKSPARGDLDFGEIVLQPVVAVAGTIVGTDGKPVAGADIWSYSSSKGVGRSAGDRTRTKSDPQGKFQLTGIAPRSYFFFVDHPDFRFTGGEIPLNGKPTEIRLARHDESPVDASVSLLARPEMLRGQHLASLVKPMFPDTADAKSDAWLVYALQLLAKFDAETVVDHLEKVSSDDGRFRVLLALGEIDEALQVARSMDAKRAFSRLTAAAVKDNIALDDQQRLLTEAATLVPSASSPDDRVLRSGTLITLLRRIGEDQAAQRLLDQQKDFAMTTEVSDFAALRFSQALAPVDPKAALQMIKQIEREFEQRRAFGNAVAASGAGGISTVKEFLKNSNDPDDNAGYLTRAVFDLATIDLPGTLQLVDEAKDRYRGLNKGRSYGYIAMAIHRNEPEQAKTILREAFQVLGREGTALYQDAAVFTLLRLAETIDPESTGEYWWRAVAALGGPISRMPNATKEVEAQLPGAQLAMLLSLYDRFPKIQEAIVEPLFDFWEAADTPGHRTFRFGDACIAALVLYDPPRSIELFHRWWPNGDDRYQRSPDSPWVLAATLLSSDGLELGRVISAKVDHQWLLGWDYRYR